MRGAERQTELGHFKVHYHEELVFILRRPFTNFRLPDLLEPLIQTHEMEDEQRGEFKTCPAPYSSSKVHKNEFGLIFFFKFRADDDDTNEQILTL